MSGAAAAETGGEMREPKPLGSLDSWAKANGMEPKDPDTLSAYTFELGRYNEQRANWLGISVEELHGLPSAEAAAELEEETRARDKQAEQRSASGSMIGRIETRSGQVPLRHLRHHQS